MSGFPFPQYTVQLSHSGPAVGDGVIYVLTTDELQVRHAERANAQITALHTASSVDLTITLNGQSWNRTNVTYGTTPGCWYRLDQNGNPSNVLPAGLPW